MNQYDTIDPTRAALAGGTATHEQLFAVLEYVRAHRNRDPRCKTFTEMAYELNMRPSVVREGLWYWGFHIALDNAERTVPPKVEAKPPLKPGQHKPRTHFKFNPHGFNE